MKELKRQSELNYNSAIEKIQKEEKTIKKQIDELCQIPKYWKIIWCGYLLYTIVIIFVCNFLFLLINTIAILLIIWIIYTVCLIRNYNRFCTNQQKSKEPYEAMIRALYERRIKILDKEL